MRSRSLPAAALLAMVALSTSTAHADTATQRAEARRLLAPVDRVADAFDARGPELLRHGNEWSATVAPCVRDGYAQLTSAATAGTIPADASGAYAAILYLVASVDAAGAMAEPLDAELAAAQRSYRRMRISDPVLRAGAREKARQLATLRGLPDVDTCGVTQAWAAAGFSELGLPMNELDLAQRALIGGPAVERAAKRLGRFGIPKRRAAEFTTFPMTVAAVGMVGVAIPPL